MIGCSDPCLGASETVTDIDSFLWSKLKGSTQMKPRAVFSQLQGDPASTFNFRVNRMYETLHPKESIKVKSSFIRTSRACSNDLFCHFAVNSTHSRLLNLPPWISGPLWHNFQTLAHSGITPKRVKWHKCLGVICNVETVLVTVAGADLGRAPAWTESDAPHQRVNRGVGGGAHLPRC